MLRDYECKNENCNHKEADVWILKLDEEVLCPKCNKPMSPSFPRPTLHVASKTENKLPSNYNFSRGGVGFGKLI